MTKTGIFAAAAGLAAIVMVILVVPGMRNAGFIIRAYVITAVIVTGYIWFLSRRLHQARRGREARREDAGS